MMRKVGIVVVVLCSVSIFMLKVDAQQYSRGEQGQSRLPIPSPQKLPRWRGFNLTEKINAANEQTFLEEDFRLISELGFNFVRLPMDYRTWIEGGNPNLFKEETFKGIDQAIQWGKKYQIHVQLNFHRAPGYTVARPSEKTNLWTNTNTQEVCAKHWAYFAKRYKGISNAQLSFNLINEPSNVDKETYITVIRKLVEAIRREDPNRLIVIDGLNGGTEPVPELSSLNIAQNTRGYIPMEVSHFKASWIDGADQMPEPQWPYPMLTAYFCGSIEKKIQSFLEIHLNDNRTMQLRLHIDTVVYPATLIVQSNGKTIWEKDFSPSPEQEEWEKAIHIEQWNINQNYYYNHDFVLSIPRDTKIISIGLTKGYWITIPIIGLNFNSASYPNQYTQILPRIWGQKQGGLVLDSGTGTMQPFSASGVKDRQWLWNTELEPWIRLKASGVGVMVGEWGAFNQTPHTVVLKWMKDNLENWKEADIGWALWNFRGSFGILDSERKDVQYESFHGHKLDREMLELLQKY